MNPLLCPAARRAVPAWSCRWRRGRRANLRQHAGEAAANIVCIERPAVLRAPDCAGRVQRVRPGRVGRAWLCWPRPASDGVAGRVHPARRVVYRPDPFVL